MNKLNKKIDSEKTSYWSRRNKRAYNKLEKDEAKLEKQLKIYYEQTAKKLDKEISRYYAKYGEDNVLKYRAMLKSLSSYEAEMLIRDVDLFTQAHPELSYLVGVRKSIYKLDRLEGLRVSIELEQMELAHKEKELIEKHLVDTYERVLSDMYKDFGYGFNFNTINRDVAKRFIGQKWVDGKSFSDSIYNNRTKVANHIMKDFRNAMIRGDSYSQAAKIFTDKFVEVSMRNAMRLIRTEGTHVLNEASISYWDKEGFEEYRYSAIWDDRTSQICMDLDGQVFKMEERQAGSNFPPMHPNCRSGYEPIVPKDWEDKLGKKYEEDVEGAEKSGYNNTISIKDKLKEKVKNFNLSTATVNDVVNLGAEINKHEKIYSIIGNKDELKKRLGDYREFGGIVPKEAWAKGASKAVKKQLEDAFFYYPKEWSQIPLESNRKLYVRKSKRGFFSSDGAIKPNRRFDITLKDYRTGYITICADGIRKTTPYHEIGHMVEWKNKDVLRIEKEFVEMRTKNEKEVRLKDIFPGVNYRSSEVTKKDDFISPYIGKVYDDATEVLSMGLQGMFETSEPFAKSYDVQSRQYVLAKITDDEEFLNLIIGLVLKG